MTIRIDQTCEKWNAMTPAERAEAMSQVIGSSEFKKALVKRVLNPVIETKMDWSWLRA